jgi:tetratricopeptide (TPR) repeat protein
MLRPIILAIQGLAVLAALPVAAQTASTTTGNVNQQLVDQARYWEDRGRYDLAKESWLKLLRIVPDDATALNGLAMAEALSGRPAAAQEYLAQLRAAHPNDAHIASIEDAINNAAINGTALDKARALAQEGQYDEAVEAYQQIFGGQKPSGRVALEYYQTLAGATGGWAPARTGLEELVREYPGDPIYKLALAQHLTYEEDTRREGIESLRALSGTPEVAKGAQQAWRQALLWLGTDAADVARYQAYLTRYGNDTEIAARLQASRSTGEVAKSRAPTAQELRGAEVKAAFAKLDAGQVQEAEEAFQAILAKAPRDDGALGGLGIIRLRQERYGEARQLLESATAAAPGNAARWKQALGSARFWERVASAQAAHDAGNLAESERLFRAALASDPAIAGAEPSVSVALAGVLAEQDKNTEAEKIYREVLRRDPRNADATQGLVSLLASSGRLSEALALVDTLSPDQQADIGGVGALRAQALRDRAEAARLAGDTAGAETLLKQALLEDPDSAWTRMDLARLYQQQDRVREANTLIDGLLVGANPMPDALYIKALLLSQDQRWFEGLQTLEQIPAGSRTAAMSQLQQRLWLRYQAERAGVYARYGRKQEAGALLAQLKPYAKDSPEMLGVLAAGLADIGQEGEALSMMHQAIAQKGGADTSMRMQYASLLFKLQQDAEFEVVVDDLLKRKLTPDQSLDLANMRIGYQLRQADVLRGEGNLARAYEYLRPLMEANPNDPRVLMALSRLYNDSRDFDQALALNQRVLLIDPSNVDAYKGAIGAALGANQPSVAQAYLEQAMALEPNSAQLYASAARLARAQGQEGKALQLYRQALLLEQQQPSTPAAGPQRYVPELQLIDPARSNVYSGASAPPAIGTPVALAGAPVVSGSQAQTLEAPRTTSTTRLASALAEKQLATVAVTPVAASPLAEQTPAVAASAAVPVAQAVVASAPASPTSASPAQSVPVVYPVKAAPQLALGQIPEEIDRTLAGPELMQAQAQTTSSDTVQPLPPLPALPVPQAPGAPRAPVIYPYSPTPQSSGPRIVQSQETAQILSEMEQIRADRSPTAGLGVSFRNRDGVKGLDQLYNFEAPVELTLPATDVGRFELRVVPVYLDAGQLSGSSLENFGTLALVGDDTLRFDQNDFGTAVSAAYEAGSFHADFGSSPLGFGIETLVGGVNWRPSVDNWSFKLDVARRSVTDSLLSYAGARDPGLGDYWGGVTRNGGRFDASYDFGGIGVYGNAGYALYEGNDVKQNNEYEAGAGVYARAYKSANASVTLGLNFTSFFFDDNLRRFSYGQGGYFSPQSYFSVAVPVEWTGVNGRLSYRVNGAIGVQTFEEDPSAVYPNDPELQSALEAYSARNPDLDLVTYYPSQTSTGIGLNFGGQVEYLVAPNLSIGASLGFDNARDYNETSALGYLRYWFYPQRIAVSPPAPVQPYYNYQDPTR